MAIELTIVVDTLSLPQGGSDPLHPTRFGHAGAYMITDSAHCVSETPTSNGTADLHLKAASGETLRVWASSLSNQFEDEVFIYDFKHNSGPTILDSRGLNPQSPREFAQVPVLGAASHRPPTFTTEKRNFPAAEIDVVNSDPNPETFLVDFMVFGPVLDASGTRALKGYYEWDPSITAI